MMRKNYGAKFQITVDGKSRSYRDTREAAVEAGMVLKQRHPPSEVVVRDLENNVHTVIGWKNGSAFSSEPVSLPQSSVTLVPRSN
jgi:hypothetical protein